jgi:predicted dehydrogenase
MVAITSTLNDTPSTFPTTPLSIPAIEQVAPLHAHRELSIGVIGCGYWGPKLARNFREIEGSRLAMVSDLSAERLADMSSTFPDVEITQDYKQLLNNSVDGVVIATPVRTHYQLAKAALFAGKHVLIEKPITARSDHAEELIQLAAERKLTLMVGHTFVYNPAVEAVQRIVQSKELGDVYYLNSVRANLGLLQPDINVMWDLGPHDISMIGYVLGEKPVSVSARGASYIKRRNNLHEVVYVTLIYESGAMANLRLSWLDPIKQRILTVIGSKKMLVYNDMKDEKVWIYDKGVEIPPYSTTETEFKASYRNGPEQCYPIEWEEPLQAECAHFLDCIRTGKPSRSSGEEGLKVVRVLETAQRSLLNHGVELRIEY